MKQYLQMLEKIMNEGVDQPDRTGVGTRSLFGYQMHFPLNEGFPIVTTKKVAFRLVKTELLWFLHGDTNIRYLLKHNNHIWDEWAFEKWVNSEEYKGPDMTDFGIRSAEDEAFNSVYQEEKARFCERVLEDDDFAEKYGTLGDVYGKQWRHWETRDGKEIDQISRIIDQIKNNPHSRRIILSAWNPEDIPNMALPPCHTLAQFRVIDNKLSCHLYQRSGDAFLGVPFNISSYALLTHLLARETGLAVGDFIHSFGDVHVYRNHFDQVQEQMKRTPHPLPSLAINSEHSIFDIQSDEIRLINYQSDPLIKAPVAV